MKIAALDIATCVGWAVGSGSAAPPICGSARMGKSGVATGEVFFRFDRWLDARLSEWFPDVLIFETPIMGRGSMNVAYRLMGMAAIAELAAMKRQIKAYTAENSTVMKHFVGRGGRWPSPAAKKAAVMDMCRLRGWSPVDHNAGDSLALLDFAQSLLGRGEVNRAAGPLFR